MVTIRFLQTWRNSIGDIGVPTYPYWSAMIMDEQQELKARMMIALIWFIWVTQQLLILIILLNFLIALVS
jgi:hypothetical protein